MLFSENNVFTLLNEDSHTINYQMHNPEIVFDTESAPLSLFISILSVVG